MFQIVTDTTLLSKRAVREQYAGFVVLVGLLQQNKMQVYAYADLTPDNVQMLSEYANQLYAQGVVTYKMNIALERKV